MVTGEPTSRETLVIFTCGKEPYSLRDLLDAGLFRGDMASPWQQFTHRVACKKEADRQRLSADEASLDVAAEEFRYRHDLITAEETEKWLAGFGVTLDAFSEYFVRDYFASVLGDEVEAPPIDYLSSAPDLQELFQVYLILSDELSGFATRCSWRAAASQEGRNQTVAAGLIKTEEKRFFAREGIGRSTLSEWLEQLGREMAWFEKQILTEANFRQQGTALLTPRMRQRELAALRLPLTRFDAEIIEFDSHEAAREAFLCARDDGLSLAEIAAEGRYPYRNSELVLESIDSELQSKFFSLVPGSLLEPLARGDGFELCKIIGKHEPDGEDPAVRDRIEQDILTRHFNELAARHVTWHVRLESME